MFGPVLSDHDVSPALHPVDDPGRKAVLPVGIFTFLATCGGCEVWEGCMGVALVGTGVGFVAGVPVQHPVPLAPILGARL